MSVISTRTPTETSTPLMLNLNNIQDEINKIKYYYEVQKEMEHSIALIIHCLNIQSIYPMYNKMRIPKDKYMQIANNNYSLPALISIFLFNHNYLLEIHDTLIQQIKIRNIKNKEQFIYQLFLKIFHSPQIPAFFQFKFEYNILGIYMENIYELYQKLVENMNHNHK